MQSNKPVMSKRMFPPSRPTAEQMAWVESERLRTGNGYSAVLRSLLQEKVEAQKLLGSESITS